MYTVARAVNGASTVALARRNQMASGLYSECLERDHTDILVSKAAFKS